MGIFNLLGLGKEKNEIASFKYEDGLKNLENLDAFFQLVFVTMILEKKMKFMKILLV